MGFPWLVLLPLLLIAGGFIFVGRLISRLGGWKQLADSYPNRDDATEVDRLRFQSMRLQQGWFPANYNNAVTIEACESGVRFRLTIPFIGGHLAFFVPWGELKFGEKRQRWLKVEIPVVFQAHQGITLLLAPKQADRIVAAAQKLSDDAQQFAS